MSHVHTYIFSLIIFVSYFIKVFPLIISWCSDFIKGNICIALPKTDQHELWSLRSSQTKFCNISTKIRILCDRKFNWIFASMNIPFSCIELQCPATSFAELISSSYILCYRQIVLLLTDCFLFIVHNSHNKLFLRSELYIFISVCPSI